MIQTVQELMFQSANAAVPAIQDRAADQSSGSIRPQRKTVVVTWENYPSKLAVGDVFSFLMKTACYIYILSGFSRQYPRWMLPRASSYTTERGPANLSP